MKIQGKGQLRHCFFGSYSAVIALSFTNPSDASLALPLLGQGWKIAETESRALIWQGDSAQLSACKEVLGSFGADTKKIDSLAKSVDFGEPFQVELNVEDPNQLRLPI